MLLTSKIFAPREEFGEQAVGAEGGRRPSGREEGEAACRGRCGGGPASPRRQETARTELLSIRLRARSPRCESKTKETM